MAEVLPKKSDFELTVSFWKTYKPDSVDGKGLTNALKEFETKHKEAQQADNLDDEKGKNFKAVQTKLTSWKLAGTALNNVKEEIDKAIKLLTKEKDSHVNLKDAMERMSTLLKRGAHILQMAITKKYDHYLELQGNFLGDSPKKGEEDEKFYKWLDNVDTKEIRNWAQAGREFEFIVKLKEVKIDNPSELAINTVFSDVAAWKRSGVFGKLSSPKNVHSNIDRQLLSLKKASNDMVVAIKELLEPAKECPELGKFLKAFANDINTEKAFWKERKEECPVEEK